MSAREDVEIFKKCVEDIIRDLGLPPHSIIRKELEKSIKEFEEAVDEEEQQNTSSDYDRAMKGII